MIYMLLGTGFEETEAIAPLDLLRRAGIDVQTVGLNGKVIYGSHNIGVEADIEIQEMDLSKMEMDLSLFETYTRGFLQACPGLTPLEKQMLPTGAKLMTLECGIRFLADYLNGDTYFRTSRPGHNLDRARNQFKLVSDMEKDTTTDFCLVSRAIWSAFVTASAYSAPCPTADSIDPWNCW